MTVQLPIAAFREEVASKLWDDSWRASVQPAGLMVTVEPCEQCGRLLNHTVYARSATEWRLYAWCLTCDHGRLDQESCPGLEYPCGAVATREYHTRTGQDCETARGVVLHYCERHYAELTAPCIPDGQDGFDDVPAGDGEPTRCPSGQTIARAFHKDFNRFITTVRTLDGYTRMQWAIAYSVYMGPRNLTRTPLTAEHILGVWHKAMEQHPQERARGAAS